MNHQDDLKEVLFSIKETLKEINAPPARELHYSQGAPSSVPTVSSKIENPITWIGFLSVFLMFIAGLMYSIYTSDKSKFMESIKGNTTSIEAIEESQSKTSQLVLKMQSTQDQISKHVANMTSKLEKMDDNIGVMGNSRFTDKQGDRLKADIENYVRRQSEREQKDISEIRGEIRAMNSDIQDLKYIKALIEANATKLKDRTEFFNETKSRLRELEKDQ